MTNLSGVPATGRHSTSLPTAILAVVGGVILAVCAPGYLHVPAWFQSIGPWLFVLWYLSWAVNPVRSLLQLVLIMAVMAFPVLFAMAPIEAGDKISVLAHFWAAGCSVIGVLYVLSSIYGWSRAPNSRERQGQKQRRDGPASPDVVSHDRW